MRKDFFTLLRPYVCSNCRVRAIRNRWLPHARAYISSSPPTASTARLKKADNEREKQVEGRIRDLGGPENLHEQYPRYVPLGHVSTLSAKDYRMKYGKYIEDLSPNESNRKTKCTVYGRLVRKRRFGAALNFFVLGDVQDSVQCTVNLKNLKNEDNDAMRKRISGIWRNAQRGDWIAITGHIQKTQESDIGLLATEWPQTFSPTLRTVPETVSSPDFLNRNRHVQQIVRPESRDILRLRHRIIAAIRNFLTDKGFIEVSTPLLVRGAGGAAAKPFETYATEFLNMPLNLRIAPELWLKRLIVGNMEKIFEIGPAFRNEGVDFTHNPEFTICEFYQVFTPLSKLISMTENLFQSLISVATEEGSTSIGDLNLKSPFRQLPFIPTLVAKTQEIIPNWEFPDLNAINAKSTLLQALDAHNLSPIDTKNEHGSSTLQVLDILASHVLEPLCVQPTFITHHPECMSPLAKSFEMEYPFGTHTVAARAELFIQGREYVNCYEEENSPVEQRRKFEAQLSNRDNECNHNEHIDENYIKALEWGMPPTGGWGCGVDRIVMLLGGKQRIADVLPFGNLTNVVRLGESMSAERPSRQDGVIQNSSSEEGVDEDRELV